MNVSIFGLGYVGTVSLGCLAKSGNKVIGVDIKKRKVDLINKGKSTILEPGLDELISSGVRKKNITATIDYKYAVNNTDITLVCIGTPGKRDGSLNLKYLFNSLKQIAEGIKLKKSFHTVVIRSTIEPGTSEILISVLEEYSGKKKIKDFCVIINPEFLREGSAVNDFFNPPMNIFGTDCGLGVKALKKLYAFSKCRTFIVTENVAEIIKLISNTFHSVKISFANEVGNLCKKLNVDSNEIMKIFSEDTILNISSAYLKPGFAFGGSCLPKDLRAFKRISDSYGLKTPLISGAKLSNEYQIKRAYDLIKSLGSSKIGIWGLSFKVGTDDMRESPIIKVINLLIKNKFKVKAYDANVKINRIIGSNKEYIRKNFKNLNDILEKDFVKFLRFSNILVVNSYDKELIKIVKKQKNKIIFDLIGIQEISKIDNYRKIC